MKREQKGREEAAIRMATATRHRRFQFGLRTMFVAVTLIAVFLAYHVNWIRERHAFIEELQSSKGDANLTVFWMYDNGFLAMWREASPGVEYDYMKTRFSWTLRLLGEPRMAVIHIPEEFDQSVRTRAARLFPEADVTDHM